MEIMVSPHLDDSDLDKRLSITFETNAGNAIFYPKDAQSFIDGLVELNEDYTTNILSEDEDISPDEKLEFLGESVLGYLDSNNSNSFYYTNLKDFLENNGFNSAQVELSDDSEEAELTQEVENELAETPTILESIDSFIEDMSLVTEVKFKKVIRGGIVRKIIDCPPGFKSVAGRCVHMTATETRKRAKAAFKGRKTRKKHSMNAAFVKALQKKRVKSMKIRSMKNL